MQGCLLGTGTEGEGGERVKARPCAPTRETEQVVDRRQNNGIVYYAIAVSTVVGQSHKDNFRCTAVE